MIVGSKRGATHNSGLLFSDAFSALSGINQFLSTTKTGQAGCGRETLDIFITELKVLKTHLQSNKLFTNKIIALFRNCVAMITQISDQHVLNGWHRFIPLDSSQQIFQGYVDQFNDILDLLNQIKALSSKINIKFISDMIVHFRLYRATFSLFAVNLKILDLKNNNGLNEILQRLTFLEMECGYLKPKIVQMDRANQVYDGYQASWSQCYYGMLSESTQVSMPDATGKLIETINPKNVLLAIREDTDERNKSHAIHLSSRMAIRLLKKEETQKIIASILGNHNLRYTLSKDDLYYSWCFLDYYFKNVDLFLEKRKGEFIAENLGKTKSSAIETLHKLLEHVVAKIRQGNELSEDLVYFQIVSDINNLSIEYKPEKLNDSLIKELGSIIEAQKEKRWADFEVILRERILPFNQEAQLVKTPLGQIILPSHPRLMNELGAKLRSELKKQRCKLKCIFEKNNLKIDDLYTASMSELETFSICYSKIITELTEKLLPVEGVINKFAEMEIASSETISGRQFLIQNPPKPEKEKTRGTPQPVENEKEIPLVDKFALLFGEEHKNKSIKRCRMKSMVKNFYVCLEENPGKDDCTIEEREQFLRLFEEPKQARKKGDTGFKLSGTQKSSEVTLCAKLLGKSGKKRAYPYQKIESKDKSCVLFLYRSIVNKGSQKEQNHVVHTVKAQEVAKSKAPGKKKRTHNKKGKK